MSYTPSNPNGQATMTNSSPVVIASNQSDLPVDVKSIEGYYDPANSSTTPLGANATFTGASIEIVNYAAINVAVYSDVNSATNGFRMEFSPDGTNWDHSHTFSLTGAPAERSYAQSAELRYFRVVYINGAVAQTAFRLTTVLKTTTVSPSRYTVEQPLTGGQMADVTKSVIFGKTTGGGGGYVDVKVNPSGALTVEAQITNAAGAAAVNIQDGGNSITVDGPLTDTQLRATAVPISGTVSTGLTQPLTDTQLRATAVPVSGPLTDAQLRATPVPVSGTVIVNAGTGIMDVSITNELLNVGGSVATELPDPVPLSDSTANPTAPHVGSCIEGFNGTTWDRLRTDTALQGNGANDGVVGVLAAGSGPGFSIRVNPTNLATAVNSVSAFNVDGANSLTIGISTTTTGTFIIEATVDNTNWITPEVFDGTQDLWVSGQNITPTLGRVYQVLTQGYRQIRLRTVTTLGATVQHFVTLSTAQQFLGGIDTGPAQHNFGYVVRNFTTEYTTTQTGAAIWTPTTGRRFVVTDFTISTGGTTAGVVTLWQGASADTTYTVGTDPAVFRGEFSPTATAKPGVVKSFAVPWMSSTVDHVLRITSSAAMTLYVQINGYEI